MKRRTILFVMNQNTPDDHIRKAAEAAAQSEDHLTCVVVWPTPPLQTYSYGFSPYGGMSIPDNWVETVNAAREELRDRAQAVEALLSHAGVSGDVQPNLCATLDVKTVVARLARVSDEAFLDASLRDSPEVLREAASGVLFHSPIAVRLNGSVSQKHDRIFVAWDSSEAASKAVHTALPYLKEAQEVVIACIDPVMTPQRDGQDPGTDVASWLSHHGCHVTVSQFPSGEQEVAECIQSRAQEFGADLVVMGAYGHARMIQTLLGGTTRSMMDQTDLPVLFAH